MGGQDRADASNLLIPGKVLLLLPRLVPLVGLNEAIVLQQVRFLTAPDRAPADATGRRWVRLSYASWQERHFPFWGCDTIKRAFRALETEGFLLSERPQRAARDQTKAYAIDYRRLDELERALRAAAVGTAGGRAPARGKRVATGLADAAALPASNLLLDDHPLVIIPHLAVLIGLDEAIVLQQVRYWLADARGPRAHEGRRWVRFTHQEWSTQIPRSPRTLGTIFRGLEARGLLLATTTLNAVRGDQTRWYTIDFDALAALEASAGGPAQRPGSVETMEPDGKSAPIETANLRSSGPPGPDGKTASIEMVRMHPANGKDAPLESATLRQAIGRSAHMDAATLPASLKDPETDHETSSEIQQQGRAGAHTVVVGNNTSGEGRIGPPGNIPGDGLVETLARRGITGVTARELAARWPERISPQVAIYDWLREGDATDPRYHPGRLRRMIEEDWASPPGFLVRAEREARRATRGASVTPGGAIAAPTRVPGEGESREAIARQLGVREADQVAWQALLSAPPGFPPFMRQALFCPPPEGARTAAVIFGDEPTRARAEALPAAVRGRLAMRIAARYRVPFAEVAFFTRMALLAQLGTGDD